ncbi:MAG: mandelate racemase/muconate lactonizing enzyme family protein [Candidatus Poribacteria bacterium]|nr:mandelate racemase/muconate lactonizing enzyme family protein [Candidatus Poribacteria bacterium]
MPHSADIRILDVSYDFETHQYRTPLKFGGVPTDRCVLFNARVRVQTRDGKEAEGFGSMPLGNAWAFPPRYVPFDQSLDAMKRLAVLAADKARECNLTAHPLDLSEDLEPEFLSLAADLSKMLNLSIPIPKLCTVVTTSPIDAAIWDGFGKANGVNIYQALGEEWVSRDLSHYLNDRFKGKYLDSAVWETPQARMPLYHLIGALDPLTDGDIPKRLNDELPETLPEWIHADGLTHLKVKLNGSDLDWDAARFLGIENVVAEAQAERGVTEWFYSADFNETCQNVEYLLEWLARIREGNPLAFERLAYIEQPTDRDLKSHPENKMHEAAKVRPVVIDESLTDFETLLLAQEQGYTGVALKACKGQSQALLMGAAAQEYGMFLAVQDLTCPGASFLHSAGLAARVKTITAIEGNGRQYCPDANDGWREQYPSIFEITDGTVGTSVLTKPGIGH